MKNKLRELKRLFWNRELAEDIICAMALFAAIAFMLVIGLGGPK